MRTLQDRQGTRTNRLSARHLRMFRKGSGIAPDVLEARGVRTISSPSELPKAYSARQRRRGPGWLATLHRPNGETSTVFRPDAVDPDNPGHKYEQEPKACGGAGNVLDVHPFCREWLEDLEVPLIFCEGTKKADSLISALRAAGERAVVVAITGVYNWLHRPDKSTSEPIPDLGDIPLGNRKVAVMFDSDVLVKWQVQLAARRLAEYARDERGARVYMTYLEHGEDGSKVGVDDYLAGGGTLGGLRRRTRRYDPKDFRLIRLGRDERLRAMLADLARTFWSFPWRGMGGHSARDVLAIAIEEAEASAAVVGDGLRIELSHRRWQERARVSSRTFYKCLHRLEAAGIGYRDMSARRRKRDKPGAFVLRAGVNQDGTEQGTEPNATPTLQGLYARGLHLRAPRLRWSSPGYTPRRGVVKGTRRVRQAPAPKPRPSIKRPGKIRCAQLDTLDEAGGRVALDELAEMLHVKRPRDLTRRKRTPKGREGLLIMLIDDGIVELQDGVLCLAGDWLERLAEVRAAGGELDADERDRARHARERVAYRSRHKRGHESRPTVAGLESVRRSHAKRADEMLKDAGSIADLKHVPDPAPELLEALRDVMRRWPHHRDDYPGWFRLTLWAESYTAQKPDPVAVEVALHEIRRGCAA